jgi:hypothetical protein
MTELSELLRRLDDRPVPETPGRRAAIDRRVRRIRRRRVFAAVLSVVAFFSIGLPVAYEVAGGDYGHAPAGAFPARFVAADGTVYRRVTVPFGAGPIAIMAECRFGPLAGDDAASAYAIDDNAAGPIDLGVLLCDRRFPRATFEVNAARLSDGGSFDLRLHGVDQMDSTQTHTKASWAFAVYTWDPPATPAHVDPPGLPRTIKARGVVWHRVSTTSGQWPADKTIPATSGDSLVVIACTLALHVTDHPVQEPDIGFDDSLPCPDVAHALANADVDGRWLDPTHPWTLNSGGLYADRGGAWTRAVYVRGG